ncbi:MAG TPA: ATP phosphoribosyltransferase regulatory subunit [Candidatus Acidoferrales bacterium]|nr:ATP phosphoribosyltransferase regulatory subunit [Candidatus Acidoferrales bacterium]
MRKHNPWLLPDAVTQVLPPAARELDLLGRALMDLFWSWGYDAIDPPLIEYLESLLTGTGRHLDLDTFKITDQASGRLMGVRADITPQAARIDAQVLDGEGPRRLCYLGPVLHARPDVHGGSRCPLQIGAELFGDAGLGSDLEAMSLMLEMLVCAGVDDLHLDLGHVGIYRALVREAGLMAADEQQLFQLLQRKAMPELRQFLDAHSMPRELAAMLWALPDLNGPPEVMVRARAALATAGAGVAAALAELATLAERVAARYPAVTLHLDLAELRGYDYHTGVVFAAFQPGRGQDLARGGRYDHVGEVFGRARPATGFSADLHVLHAAGRTPSRPQTGAIWAPAVGEDASLEAAVAALRHQGERVVRALTEDNEPPSDLGIDRRLTWRDGQWRVEAWNP